MSDTAVSSVLLYLELSVVIALGFVLFRGVRWLAARLGLRVGSAGMSRIARAVFLATVLSPVAVHLVLSAPIPDFVRRVPFAGATVSEDALAAALAGAPRLLAERLIPGGEQSVWSFLRGLEPWQVELAVALAAAFLLSGFAVGAMRTAARIGELRALVRAAAPLRRIGRVSIVVSDRARVPFSTTVLGRAHVVAVRPPAPSRSRPSRATTSSIATAASSGSRSATPSCSHAPWPRWSTSGRRPATW